MAEFSPVDHKDSDPEYRASVRRHVEARMGEPLLPVTEAARIVGRWILSFPTAKSDRAVPGYEFFADGTFRTSDQRAAGKFRDKWRIERSESMVITEWCPPMPEYGITEGCWTEEAFHCALLASGGFVRWNGDGSLVQLFTPAPAAR